MTFPQNAPKERRRSDPHMSAAECQQQACAGLGLCWVRVRLVLRARSARAPAQCSVPWIHALERLLSYSCRLMCPVDPFMPAGAPTLLQSQNINGRCRRETHRLHTRFTSALMTGMPSICPPPFSLTSN